MQIGIREATLNDAVILFEWANNPETRQNSFNKHNIEWHNHINWLKKRLYTPSCKIYILLINEKPVGVVRFDINETTIIGITVAPDHRGLGLGADFLKIACNTYWKSNGNDVLAYIKKENIASLRVFEKAGFTFLKEDVFNGFECLILKAEKMRKSNFELNKKVLIIAELSANHGQKLEVALETIKAAKRAGADAIKLQTYTADTLTLDCDNKYFTDVLKGTIWEGRRLYELYQEAYTPWEWHKVLFEAAQAEGLICFSSPFDKTAVDFLEQFNPIAYKIASFEIQDVPLIEYAASKGRLMIMSTGIAELKDIELAIQTCRNAGNNNIILLKCTSSYPAPIDEANLATIQDLKTRFGVDVGLSDHTIGIVAPVVAVSLGARVIEKHFILNKSVGGPDSSFSLDENEFTAMVKAIREAERAIGKVTYKLTDRVKDSRKFSRSLFVVKDIKAGEVFTEENIRSIRPGYGLHPKYLNLLLGKKALKDLDRGTPLNLEH